MVLGIPSRGGRSKVDYEGWFVKKDAVWLINRWSDRPDVNFEGGQ
jgi:hypothetical protein